MNLAFHALADPSRRQIIEPLRMTYEKSWTGILDTLAAGRA
ncbi:MAG: hypothetical protein ACYS0E_16440 [Planctomycetota bacterium]